MNGSAMCADVSGRGPYRSRPASQACTPDRYTSRSMCWPPVCSASPASTTASSGPVIISTRRGVRSRPDQRADRASPRAGSVAVTSTTVTRPAESADTGRIHTPQFLLQVGYLVPQPGGQLELEIASRGEHLVGQLLDQIGQLGPGHRRGVPPDDDPGAGVGPTRLPGRPLAARGVPPGSADRDQL